MSLWEGPLFPNAPQVYQLAGADPRRFWSECRRAFWMLNHNTLESYLIGEVNRRLRRGVSSAVSEMGVAIEELSQPISPLLKDEVVRRVLGRMERPVIKAVRECVGLALDVIPQPFPPVLLALLGHIDGWLAGTITQEACEIFGTAHLKITLDQTPHAEAFAAVKVALLAIGHVWQYPAQTVMGFGSSAGDAVENAAQCLIDHGHAPPAAHAKMAEVVRRHIPYPGDLFTRSAHVEP